MVVLLWSFLQILCLPMVLLGNLLKRLLNKRLKWTAFVLYVVSGAEDEKRLRSMMGMGDNEEETSSLPSPSLQIYGCGGSSPLRTISWTRLASNTSRGRTETPAIFSALSWE